MSLEVFPPLQFFGRVGEGLALTLHEMFGRIHQGSPPVLGLSLLGEFFTSLIQSPYSLLACSDFLFLHESVLVDCMFLGMYPFLLGFPVCCHIIVHNSLMIFCISGVISCNVSFFNLI